MLFFVQHSAINFSQSVRDYVSTMVDRRQLDGLQSGRDRRPETYIISGGIMLKSFICVGCTAIVNGIKEDLRLSEIGNLKPVTLPAPPTTPYTPPSNI